jgi:hypothetical protein
MPIWSSTTSAWVVPGARQTLKTPILKAVINDLLEGQYRNPVCVIGFNLSEGWVRDVSEEIVRRLRERCGYKDRELPESLHQFVEQGAGT